MSDFAKDTNVPTNDCISRQSAIGIVLKYAKRLREPIGTPEDNEMYAFGRGLLIGIERNLKQLPSVERKGRWVQTNPPERSDNIVCDQCGYDSIAKFIYCPNCGATMEGEEG